MRKYFVIAFCIALMASVSSCSLEPTLADELGTDIPDVATMRQMVNGSYSNMTSYAYWGRDMIIAGEVRADNVYSNGHSGRFITMSNMNLQAVGGDVNDMFGQMYTTIANPNIIINTDVSGVEGDQADKMHIVGEAYAVRAMAQFDLIRVFGQAYSEADASGNRLGISYKTEFKTGDLNQPRGTIAENKAQIYADLASAIDYMTQGAASQYAHNKTNLTLDAVYALKSRVAVYFKDYDKAYEAAGHIINNYSLTPASDYAAYWSAATPGDASIFELAQSPTDNQGINGLAYIYRGNSYGDIQCFDNLIASCGFDAGDVRAASDMIDFDGSGALRNMGKYPHMGTELGIDNIKVMRFSEVVLNYAEAALLKSSPDAGTALTYLNMVPNNRNATPYTAATLQNILKERRKEFLFEGFRFFDLARTGQDIPDVDPAIASHGFVPAGSYRYAMPIPQKELDTNHNSVQNPGY